MPSPALFIGGVADRKLGPVPLMSSVPSNISVRWMTVKELKAIREKQSKA